jgi:hypothetical protein
LRARRAEPLVPSPRLAPPGTGRLADDRDLRCASRQHRRLREPVYFADRASLAAQSTATQSTRPDARHLAGTVGGRPAVAAAGVLRVR